MRLGCLGCLTVIVACTLGVGLIAAGIWTAGRLVEQPAVAASAASPEAARAAQQKIQAVLASPGRPRGRGPVPVAMSEDEINAVLSRSIHPRDLPLRDLAIRLPAADTVELVGWLPAGTLLAEVAPALARRLPEAWAARPVWLTVRGAPRLEATGAGHRRYVRLHAEHFAVGRQPLPTLTARLLLDVSRLSILRWPVPAHVSRLAVEPGRLLIEIE